MNTPPQARKTPLRRDRGVSIIEAMLALSTMAITLGAGLPGLNEARAKRQLDGTAAQVATDIAQARSLAVSANEPMRFTVQQDAGGSCYAIHTGSAGSCSCSSQGTATCTGTSQVHRVAGFDGSQAVRLGGNARSMLFDPDRGTVSPTGTIRLSTADGKALDLVVNIMGRVRRCASGQPMPDYPNC